MSVLHETVEALQRAHTDAMEALQRAHTESATRTAEQHKAELARLAASNRQAVDSLMTRVAGLLVERRKPGFFEAIFLLWHRPKS